MALVIAGRKPRPKAIAITQAVTLSSMTKNTRRIPKQAMEAFGRLLAEWVRDRHEDNQSKAGKALGISQGHISGMIRGEKGPGLNTLLLMRLETGKSIDEMLGFRAAPASELLGELVATAELNVQRYRQESSTAREENRALRAKISALEDEIRKLKGLPTPSRVPAKRAKDA